MPVTWGDRPTLNFKTQLGSRELKIDIVSCETDCLVVDLHMLMVTEWVSVAERLVTKGLAQWEKNAEEEEEEEKEEKEQVVMEEEQRSLSIQQIPLGDTQLDCVVSEAGSPSNFYIQILVCLCHVTSCDCCDITPLWDFYMHFVLHHVVSCDLHSASCDSCVMCTWLSCDIHVT